MDDYTPKSPSEVAAKPGPPGIQTSTLTRGRLILSYEECGQTHPWAGYGWIALAGNFVHIFSDEFESWQTWPYHQVVQIDWGEHDNG